MAVIAKKKEELEEKKTRLFNGVVTYVSNKFNLGDDYVVTKFIEKPNNVQLGMSNEDHDINVVLNHKTVFDIKVKLNLIEK